MVSTNETVFSPEQYERISRQGTRSVVLLGEDGRPRDSREAFPRNGHEQGDRPALPHSARVQRSGGAHGHGMVARPCPLRARFAGLGQVYRSGAGAALPRTPRSGDGRERQSGLPRRLHRDLPGQGRGRPKPAHALRAGRQAAPLLHGRGQSHPLSPARRPRARDPRARPPPEDQRAHPHRS